MSFHPVRDLGQIFLCMLQKLRGSAVRFQSGIILVLLLDKKAAGIGLMPMHLVHGTTRFLAGVLGQLFKQRRNFGFTPNFRHPGDC
jgi:hypothetical protein